MVTPQQRTALFAAASVALAGLAGFGAYAWLERAEADLRAEIQGANRVRPVVVANEDLSAGTAIAPESVRLVSLAADAIPDGSFEDPAQVIDRIAVVPFRRNEPVLETKLAPVEVTRGGLAVLTGQDKRAIAVRVDDVMAVAGFIRPGDRVDVLATLHTDEELGQPVTKIILENVPVLTTGGNGVEAPKTASAGTMEGAPVITLEVSPREAEKLSLAASEGKIQLMLRHPLNRGTVDTEGATVGELLGRSRGTGVPEVDRLAARTDGQAGKQGVPRIATQSSAGVFTGGHQALPPVVRVEVIRGLQRSEVQFAGTPQSKLADDSVR